MSHIRISEINTTQANIDSPTKLNDATLATLAMALYQNANITNVMSMYNILRDNESLQVQRSYVEFRNVISRVLIIRSSDFHIYGVK